MVKKVLALSGVLEVYALVYDEDDDLSWGNWEVTITDPKDERRSVSDHHSFHVAQAAGSVAEGFVEGYLQDVTRAVILSQEGGSDE